MLPKPDKNKKTFPSGEVIETKEEILAKEQKRLQKKRRYILISIIILVGLSLSFWTYRVIKNWRFSFNLPKISLPRVKSSGLGNQIKKLISSDFKDISLYIADDNGDNSFVWQQNESIIFQNQSLATIKSKSTSSLPLLKVY